MRTARDFAAREVDVALITAQYAEDRPAVPDGFTATPDLYALIGTPHEGHDCFVFRRDVYRKYCLGLVSVGAPWVGRVLLWNLVRHSQRFEELKSHHLTFHPGRWFTRTVRTERAIGVNHDRPSFHLALY